MQQLFIINRGTKQGRQKLKNINKMKPLSLLLLLLIGFVNVNSQSTFLQTKNGHNCNSANYINRIREFGYPNDYWKPDNRVPPAYYCEEIIQINCGAFSCKAIGINGKYTSYYNNGQLESKGDYTNADKSKDVKWLGNLFRSIKVGYWEFYDVSGKLIGKGNYKNDKMDGSWEINFEYSFKGPKGGEQRIIKSLVNFSNGIPNGEWSGTYPNGNPCIKCSFVNGKKSGTSLFYYEDEGVKIKEVYSSGKLVSSIEYDADGKVSK